MATSGGRDCCETSRRRPLSHDPEDAVPLRGAVGDLGHPGQHLPGGPGSESHPHRLGAAAATAHHRTYYWKQYGLVPLPPSGIQDSDIGHNVQWGAPDSVAADIDYFVLHGVPDPDLSYSDPADIRHIVVEPGKAIIVTLGS